MSKSVYEVTLPVNLQIESTSYDVTVRCLKINFSVQPANVQHTRLPEIIKACAIRYLTENWKEHQHIAPQQKEFTPELTYQMEVNASRSGYICYIWFKLEATI